MDIELKHLGQTLAVGGFAVYATIFLIRVCRAKWIPQFFEAADGKLQLQHTAVYLALVLAAGVVLEDVSKNYVARRASFFTEFFYLVLDTDKELRLRSLFTIIRFNDTEISAVPKGIFRELQKLPPSNEVVKSYLEEIQQYFRPPATPRIEVIGKDSVDAFLNAIDGVYYNAKNIVYREDTYFHELSDLSDRMDFTRSLTFLCLIFSIFYLVFFIFGYIPPLARFLDIDREERLNLFFLSLLYACGIWLVGTAYRTDVTSYNSRVFGYYIITLTLEPKTK